MPTFIYTAPSGRKIKVTGDTPPTPQQLEALFKQTGVLDESPSAPAAPDAPAPQTWADKLGLNTPTASPMAGFLKGSGAAATDMVEGAASGLMNTAFHGGDLIRRATGMERVIDTPEAQQAMRAPDSFAGQTGRFIEQGAEFAAPLAKVSKAAAGLRLLPRLAAEATAGAGAAGVQSGGNPEAMTAGGVFGAALPLAAKGVGATVRGVKNMAAAASEEGVGGAIASMIRTAAPAEPKGMIVQALKPRNSQVSFARDLSLSMPEVNAAAEELNKPIGGVRDLLDVIPAAKKKLWGQYQSILGPRRAMRATVDLSSVADAIDSSISRKLALQDPAHAARIQGLADTYRKGRFAIEDVEQLLRDTNNQLDAYYDKFPAAKRAAAARNPETAQLVAEGDALRKALYASFEDAGPAGKELMRRYGALMDLEETALRRVNVAERQQPESLSEQTGKVRAARDMAVGLMKLKSLDFSGLADMAGARAGNEAAKYLKEQQTSDALVRRAFAAFSGTPVPIEIPPGPTIAGLLPKATTRLGPKPDVSGGRSVRGEWAQPGIRPGQKALPPPSSRPMSERMPQPDQSGGRSVTAKFIDQVDPRTGQTRRVYLSDGE